MGTWDVGPFDNDTAADFSGSLDEAAEGERETLIRAALACAADTPGYLDQDIAAEAIAAAALVAAQRPGESPSPPPTGRTCPSPSFPPTSAGWPSAPSTGS